MATRSVIRWGILFFLCAPQCFGEVPLKKASFIPLWSPQAQFAGYYVALEKGIYRKHGLDLTIIRGGSATPPLQLLETGKADFAVAWLSGAIRERSRGVPLVNIAQTNQRSALMLVARKSSGISSPQDLNGKKISCWEGDLGIQPHALIKKYGLKATIIPQTYSVNLFLRGGVDVISAMWYNEYHTLLNAGIDENELTTFFFERYGLNFPEDGIYTRENTAAKDPERCRAFVEASREGWEYAFAHEDEALDIILAYMKEARVPANRVHQKWMLGKMKELIFPDGKTDAFGPLRKEDYERVASELSKNGDITEIPAFDRLYRPAVRK